MEGILSTLYPLAAAIAQPLAIASTTILLLFFLMFAIVKSLRLPLERAAGESAIRVLLVMLTYGFILALAALALAGISWFIKNSYERKNLADQAMTHIENGDVQLAHEVIGVIIENWPGESDGYKLRGAAYFRDGKYELSADAFEASSGLLKDSSACAERMKLAASWSAALGAAGETSKAVEVLRPHANCENLPKGAKFNWAKLLILNNEPELAIDMLGVSGLLTSTAAPDYRDRAHFLLAAALIASSQQKPKAETVGKVIDAIIYANCLNDDFGSIAFGSVRNGAAPPDGALMQTYQFESEVISGFLMKQGIDKDLSDKLLDRTLCKREIAL